MKKLISIALLIGILSLFIMPMMIAAQEEGIPTEEQAKAALEKYFNKIVNLARWIVGLLATVLLAIGGIMWGTAGGDPDKIAKAKKVIIGAVAMYVIVIFARQIVGLLAPPI